MDFVTKFEKALRKRHQALMTELAKIESLIDAFEKGAKSGGQRKHRLSPAARKRIGDAQRKRWRLAKAAKK